MPQNKSASRSQGKAQIASPSDAVCAQFVTTTKQGVKEVIVLSISKPVTIGRSAVQCSYVIPDIVVSTIHCKLYAVRTSTGGVVVSCQDHSTNGILLNGHKIRRTSVIIMNGDTFQIPSSQTFKCVYTNKKHTEKANIFDPTPASQPFYKSIGHYIVTSHCLGSGSFATVHLAMDTQRQRQVACKSIKIKRDSDEAKIMKEVNILMVLDHPNINRVHNVDFTEQFLHIFLQLSTGGDLFTYITTGAGLKLCEGEAKYIMYQLLKGIAYLHDKSISHRDLKPENILLQAPGPYPHIQIADFGLARPKAYQETLNVCGTVAYLPPEGILALDNRHLGYVGMPADCWSAGVILFVMLTGQHPFDYERVHHTEECSCSDSFGPSDDYVDSQFSQISHRSEVYIKSRIVDGNMSFSSPVWEDKEDARNLVGGLMIHDPLQRATVYSALRSRWITSQQSMLESAYQRRVCTGSF